MGTEGMVVLGFGGGGWSDVVVVGNVVVDVLGNTPLDHSKARSISEILERNVSCRANRPLCSCVGCKDCVVCVLVKLLQADKLTHTSIVHLCLITNVIVAGEDCSQVTKPRTKQQISGSHNQWMSREEMHCSVNKFTFTLSLGMKSFMNITF